MTQREIGVQCFGRSGRFGCSKCSMRSTRSTRSLQVWIAAAVHIAGALIRTVDLIGSDNAFTLSFTGTNFTDEPAQKLDVENFNR